MIIGHLPAGYVLSRLLHDRFARSIHDYHTFMFWGLLGSVAPDIDMFYFYLIDHRSTHHHKYFSHFPVVWLSLVALSAFLFTSNSKLLRTIASYSLVFSVSGFIHLILDTIVGDIWWLAPFVDQSFALASVPARLHPWWLNFIVHWSFALELAVVSWAVWLWHRSRKGRTPLVDHSQHATGGRDR